MIVCHCTGTTDATIQRLIDAGARNLAAIARSTGAGRCCEPCREEIRCMLYSTCQVAHTAPASPQLAALSAE